MEDKLIITYNCPCCNDGPIESDAVLLVGKQISNGNSQVMAIHNGTNAVKLYKELTKGGAVTCI